MFLRKVHRINADFFLLKDYKWKSRYCKLLVPGCGRAWSPHLHRHTRTRRARGAWDGRIECGLQGTRWAGRSGGQCPFCHKFAPHLYQHPVLPSGRHLFHQGRPPLAVGERGDLTLSPGLAPRLSALP